MELEEYHTDQRLLLMPGPHRLEVLLDPRRGFWMFSRTPVLSLHAGPGRHYRFMHELAKEKAPKGALSFLFDDGRRSASFWIAEEDAPPADRSGSVER